MSSSTTHQMLVNASTEYLSEVRNFVASYAREHGFDERQIRDIRLAVDEACTNIIKHAYHYDKTKKFEINLGTDDNYFWISIFDNGSSFDIKSYKKPDLKDQIRKKERGGCGVYLIKKLMDEVEYRKKGERNEIRMLKRI